MANRLAEIVRSKNGSFNESDYVNKRSELEFLCSAGHKWVTQVQTVLNGSWCRDCWEKNSAGKHLKLVDGLNQAKKLALERGGVCLSEKYVTTNTKMNWKCHNGHEWQAVLSDIKKGSWCPECGAGARERLVRFYFDEITGSRFVKTKPDWLTNSRGNRMELDGFSPKLRIAFEHQGEQHYREVPHFNRRDETFVNRINDDEQKRRLCKENDVKLIEVPYFVETKDLLYWIHEAVRNTDPKLKLKEIKDVQKSNYVPSTELEKLRELALQNGGACLSKIYLGTDKKHLFKCSKGHEWEALANSIKQGTWCPVCKPERIGESNRKHSIESMNSLARSNSGKFLSTLFESVNKKYEWECKLGHVWQAAPTDIAKGTWCPFCAKNNMRGTIESMKTLARERGGQCLSIEYINSQTKLRWKCIEGHEWEARPDNVKNRKSWCPICSKKKS